MSLRDSLPAQASRTNALEVPTLFEMNINAMQSAQDGLADYRMPAPLSTRENLASLEERAPKASDTRFASFMYERKDDSTTGTGLILVELAALAVFARLGLKHLSKNGITLFESASGTSKSLATSIEKAPKPISPTSISDLGTGKSTAENIHPALPRIRTKEREYSGPLRVG